MNVKKILLGMTVAAVIIAAAVTAVTVKKGLNSNKQAVNGATLANIEALSAELPEVTITCGQYSGRCWKWVETDRWLFFSIGHCEFSGWQSDYCAPI